MHPRLLLPLAAALLALLAPHGALAVAQPKTEQWRDHTLNQAGPACIAEFYGVVGKAFPPRDPCAVQVQQAFAGPNQGACPGNMTYVQQCMTPSADAFTDLVARCPLLNVRARNEGETVDTDHFSCFGVFSDPEAFRAYANGTAAPPKNSYAEKSGASGLVGGGGRRGVGGVAVAVAVAAVGGLLLR